MYEIIILTNKSEESQKLKIRLAELDPAFKEIPSFTKPDLPVKSDCKYIFSTWYMPSFSEEEIKAFFPDLKAIFYAAGTVKSFAEPFLRNGVRIFSAAQANSIPVAEFTVAQIILANKGYFTSQRSFSWPMTPGKFRKIRNISERHSGNFSPTIGLLGCGAVGSAVVKLLQPYCMNIKVYDPYLTTDKADSLGVMQASLEEIFSTCDIVSNHLPDIPATKEIINKKVLLLMKPFATLINTGRGAQIDESALVSVFRKRKDLTALLDVTRHEPPFPWSGLYRLNNVFISPHLAGSLGNEINRMIDFAYNCYIDFLMGKNPQGEVTLCTLNSKA